jgi:hypothetical protein
MNPQRRRVGLLVGVLCASVALLAWSVLSMWSTARNSGPRAEISPGKAAEPMPPALDSKGAKASLSFPVLKGRGPLPGKDVESKPLRVRPFSQEMQKRAEPQ